VDQQPQTGKGRASENLLLGRATLCVLSGLVPSSDVATIEAQRQTDISHLSFSQAKVLGQFGVGRYLPGDDSRSHTFANILSFLGRGPQGWGRAGPRFDLTAGHPWSTVDIRRPCLAVVSRDAHNLTLPLKSNGVRFSAPNLCQLLALQGKRRHVFRMFDKSCAGRICGLGLVPEAPIYE
jgi:hypothetical protein